MRKELSYETKQKLIKIYNQVEEDFKKFPGIKTTEDLFIWREQVKEENDYDGDLRNEQIESEIKGNSSLELLYDWSKCYRMIDRAKANLYMVKERYNILDNDNYRIKAVPILHRYLLENGKGNTEELFGILHLSEINLGIKYPLEQRTINTPYEFEKAVVKEEDTEPWPAPLFVTLLRAYGVDGDDLLTVGREVEALGNRYIEEIKDSYSFEGKKLVKSLY